MNGIDEVGKVLNGGDLVFVGGRPGIGKSTFGFMLADYWKKKHSQNVIIFSLEASKEIVRQRMLSFLDDFSNVIIEDKPNIQINEIYTKCQEVAKSESSLGFVLVDYLQLVGLGDKKTFSSQEKRSEILKQLKGMALELGIPVIVLSQLSRLDEYRKPVLLLRDLRSTFNETVIGTIDKIIFLHMTGEIIMAKNDGRDILEIPWKMPESLFNKTIILDDFVVGTSNRFAVAVSRSVMEQPGVLYNPLHIYGANGVGKTRLLQLMKVFGENELSLNVSYITGADFLNDFVRVKQDDTYLKTFREKYKKVNVFMIDDIQFLAETFDCQMELLRIFNILLDEKKQIVVASDRDVDELSLDEKLKSRLQLGIAASILLPDLDFRIKIIETKIQGTVLEEKLDNEVLFYIASSYGGDIRLIEGAIAHLSFHVEGSHLEKINLAIAKKWLKDYVR
ncbi:MAG: hypothetical protein K2M17_01800 [Bacilli bacterium]|nr:hypothetical protein [Bacilli bacterium]